MPSSGGDDASLRISSLIVYYNRDLFKRFGVPLPKDGMRWNGSSSGPSR